MLKECHAKEGVQVRAFDGNDKHKNDGWFPASTQLPLLLPYLKKTSCYNSC